MQPGCDQSRHGHLSPTCARRYEEDILNAKKLGCNSFRFSLEWARLEPKQGQINQDAVKRQASHFPQSWVTFFAQPDCKAIAQLIPVTALQVQ